MINANIAVIAVCAVTSICYALYEHFKNSNRKSSRAVQPFFNGNPGSKCDICLDGVVGSLKITLNCGHNFHKDCLSFVFDQVVKHNRTCPTCRACISESFILFHLGK